MAGLVTEKYQVHQMTSDKDRQTHETRVTKFFGFAHKIQQLSTTNKVSFSLLANNYSSPACVHDHMS